LARSESLGEDKEKEKEKAGRYWTWLSETKDKVDRQGSTCAPFFQPPGVKSVEELTAIRKAQLAIECGERDREYKGWLASVQKPSFVLPTNNCNSVAQRDMLIAEQAKKKGQQMSVTTLEYNKWLKETEEKHQEKYLAKAREKMNADADFDNQKKAAAASLDQKIIEAKKAQALVARQSQRELKEMYERVQRKPLMVEHAYRHNRVTQASKPPDDGNDNAHRHNSVPQASRPPPDDDNDIKIATQVKW